VCAKVQFAFDLTRERFICALCYCSQILIRTFFTKCACRCARADVVRETCAMIFDFERTAVLKCPVGVLLANPNSARQLASTFNSQSQKFTTTTR